MADKLLKDINDINIGSYASSFFKVGEAYCLWVVLHSSVHSTHLAYGQELLDRILKFCFCNKDGK